MVLPSDPGMLIYQGTNSLLYYHAKGENGGPLVVKALTTDSPSAHALSCLDNEYEVTKDLTVEGVRKPLARIRMGDRPALVFDYFSGQTLWQAFVQTRASMLELVEVAIRIVDILGELHGQRIVHHDINSHNILVDVPERRVLIIDLGLASRMDACALCPAGRDWLQGSLPYVSPEQTGRTGRRVDYRTDFYSLGVTLYELIASQLPFPGRDPLSVIHGHLAGTPRPLIEMNPETPVPLADIVAKLMAKTPEERYQSAFGLRADLERCLLGLRQCAQGGAWSMPRFELGSDDDSSDLRIPERLYGRSEERTALLDAFRRAAAGEPQVVVLYGPSGVGKSALATQIRVPVAERNGHFVTGKYGESRATTPFFGTLLALGEYADCILTEDPSWVTAWRTRVLAALGDNVAALTELAPGLRSLLGEYPPPDRLGAQEHKNRLDLTLRAFSQAIDAADRPIVVFLDDCQWIDSASLDWLKIIMSGEANHRMMVLAYRDDEVPERSPLLQAIAHIERHGVPVQRTQVRNLSPQDVRDLVADTLRWTPEQSRSLARTIHEITAGNALFVRQYLQSMVRERRLRFEPATRCWVVEADASRPGDCAATVLDLMTRRMRRLPEETARLVSEGALLGDEFRLSDLVAVTGVALQSATERCRVAVNEGLLVPVADVSSSGGRPGEARFRFQHDRVRQAAEAALYASERQEVHWRIGQALRRRGQAEQSERIFEIVGHYEAARALVTDAGEQVRLAELNLLAANRAYEMAGFGLAQSHLQAALAWLPQDAWTNHYSLMMELHSRLAVVSSLTGDWSAFEHVLESTERNGECLLDVSRVRSARVPLLLSRGEFSEAIETGVALIEALTGVVIARAPSPDQAFACLRETTAWLTEERIRSLLEIPQGSSEVDLALETAVQINGATYGSNMSLLLMSVSYAAKLCFERGLTAWSPVALMTFALMISAVDHEVPKARLLAEYTHRLWKERFRIDALLPSMDTANGGFVLHRHRHLKETLPVLAEGVSTGLRTGQFLFAGYCAWWQAWHQLFLGLPLDQVESECQKAQQTCKRARMPRFGEWCLVPHQAVLNLRGLSAAPWELKGQLCDDDALLALALRTDDFAEAFRIHVYRGWMRYLFGQFESAAQSFREAEAYLVHSAGLYFAPLYFLYDSLSHLAVAAMSTPTPTILRRVAGNLEALEPWVRHAPMNHRHKKELILAERARVEGRPWEATEHYEHAIDGARQHGFVQEEALGRELYSAFWTATGRDEMARFHLSKACNLYGLWGASAKVAHLEAAQEVPPTSASFADASHGEPSSSRNGAQIEGLLDIATLVKANQALSRSVQLDQLLTQMVTVLLESAGAERAVVLCRDGESWFIEARGWVGAPDVETGLHAPLAEDPHIPQSLFHYAVHTGAPLLLAEACGNSQFCADPHVRERQLKSVLCLPIRHKEDLRLVLYLENNLCVGAFTESRLELLRLLSGQVVISLENARFCDHLEAQVVRRTEELADAKNKAEAASRAKSDFVASISHEFRSPLSAILGFSELLLRDSDDGTRALSRSQRDDVEQVHRAGEHLAALINNVLDLSKIESGRAVLTCSEFDVHTTLMELKAMFSQTAYEKGLALHWVFDPGLVRRVRTDQVKLKQILINLLANAIKFTEKGAITLRVEHRVVASPDVEAMPRTNDDEHGMAIRLRFSVVDTGAGIDEEEKGALFEAFRQTRSGLASGQGTGLGLTICKYFVEMLGGELGLESTKGEGTVFRFEIPVRAAEGNDVDLPTPPSTRRRFRLDQRRVLVVDDNPVNRRLLVSLLKPLGCDVREAADGLEAVHVWRATKPDLTWMDMRMPVMDGYEAVRLIKSDPQGTRARIVAVTASSFLEERAKILEAGCDDLLCKPFSEEQVIQMLVKHLALEGQ